MWAYIFFTFLLIGMSVQQKETKPVVILVPGFGGSRLEARMDRNNKQHWYCRRRPGWFDIWFDIIEDIVIQACFVDIFKLNYDSNKKAMCNQTGIHIRTKQPFGDPSSVEFLNDKLKYFSSYFHPISQYLVDHYGYERNKDLFGAQYDFRSIGDRRHMTEFFQKLDDLIIRTTKKQKRKVLFITHSLGGPLISHYLSLKTQKWKTDHISSWYSISGAFGGAVAAVQAHLVGVDFLVKNLISTKNLYQIQITQPTTYFLFPSKSIFSPNKVIIKNQTTNYTVSDRDFVIKNFDKSNISNVLEFIPDIFVKEPPGVKMACVYGTKIPTYSTVVFKGELLTSELHREEDNGDGTLLYDSMSACRRWYTDSSSDIQFFEIPKESHLRILESNILHIHLGNFLNELIKEENKIDDSISSSKKHFT